MNNDNWPPRLLVNGERAHIAVESSDTNDPYMPPPISAPLIPTKATPHELLMQDVEPKEVKVIYTIFYNESDHRYQGSFGYFLEVTNVNGRDIKPELAQAKFCLLMEGHRKITIHGPWYCNFGMDSVIDYDGDDPAPALPRVMILVLLVLITIVIVATVGRFLVSAWPKANVAWKGKKTGVLFLPEHNAGQEEALLYKGENYQ